MDSVSFHATTELENKLNGIYEILYKKENNIANKIKYHTQTKKNHRARQALFLHLMINTSVLAGLFHFFY